MTAVAAHPHTGVQMPGKIVKATVVIFQGVVAKEKRATFPTVGVELELTVAQFRQDVVISLYQMKSYLWMTLQHIFKMQPFAIHLAVKKISQKNHLARAIILKQLFEALQVVQCRLVWHGNTGFTEMGDFAKMSVGNKQGLPVLPVNGLLGQEN